MLEIGCAAAGNLIPFAACHPDAQVVGIDLSPVQINHGLERVKGLGLTNLTLLQGDIATVDLSELGPFDFIICHGVYSWVPEHVQEAILSAVDRLLSPEGVAYISYNVYPGWKAKEIVRDAMLLRGGDKADPAEKLSYARGMIDFLEKVAPADSILAKALADDRALGMSNSDYYVLHDHLETFNSPCYFLDFGRRCEPYSLTYLADAMPQTMFAINYGATVAEPLLKEFGHSQVMVEQYLDFVVNRTFRQSLLVHGECAPRISFQLDRARFDSLHFAAWLPPLDGETRLDASHQDFGQPEQNVSTHDPAVKAAADLLTARWPWTTSRQELLSGVRARLAAGGVLPTANQDQRIDELLEALIMRGMARFRLEPVMPAPTGTPLKLEEPIRRMAELVRWDRNAQVFNRWHESVQLPPVDRHLLPLLDGTRDRDALADELVALLRKDVITFERDGARIWGEVEWRKASLEYIDGTPQRLRQMRLV